jgi:hypothetical protein
VKVFKRQKCSVCEYEEKFNFHVPDEVWKGAVPEEYQKRVVCLACFDEFARRNNVDYSDALNELYFAGDKASLKFAVTSAHNLVGAKLDSSFPVPRRGENRRLLSHIVG